MILYFSVGEILVNYDVHPRKLKWIPKLMGLEKVTGPFKHGNCLVFMLDFWDVI